MRDGDTLQGALEHGLKDLDGFYTFVVGTRDGFAVIRDPIACKPAVMAETDDWVAMASEYRAIAPLPGAEQAKIWEPAPATVYAWSRAAVMARASRNSVLDLAQMKLREVNQLLHDTPGGRFPHPQSARRACARLRARRPISTSRSTAMSATTAPA